MFTSGVCLVTNKTSTKYAPDDFGSYDNMRIGFVDYYERNADFADFAKEKGFTYTPITYKSLATMKTDLIIGETIDAIVVPSLHKLTDYRILTSFAPTNAYFATRLDDDMGAMNIINQAMSDIFRYNSSFNQKLYDKYYGTNQNTSTIVFTKAEEAYITLHKSIPLVVGYDNSWQPIEWKDEEGNFQGVTRDIYNLISNVTGLTFDFVSSTSFDELTKRTDLDIFSILGNDYNFSSSLNLRLSPYIFTDQIVSVTRKGVDISYHDQTIIYGVPKSYWVNRFSNDYVDGTIKNYANYEECLDALYNDEIDSVLMNSTSADYWLNNLKYKDFALHTVDSNFEEYMSFGISKNQEFELFTIFEKCSQYFTKSDIQGYFAKYQNPEFQYSLYEYFQYSNLVKFGSLSIVLIIILFVLFAVVFSRYRFTKKIYNLSAYAPGIPIYNKETFFNVTQHNLLENNEKHFIYALIQIDRYQLLNETFGSKEGNKYVKQISEYFDKRFSNVSLTTYGLVFDDSFGLCFEYTPRNMDNFAFITKDLASQYFNNINSFHIGFYIIRDNKEELVDINDYASLALERAKNNDNFRINFSYFDDEMIAKIQESNYYVSEFSRAIKNKEFVIYLQPKVRISDSKIVGAEALVRWNHPIEGIISPGKFVPIYERNGSIIELDKYVWDSTCEFISKHKDVLKDEVPISVNFSRNDLYAVDIYSYINKLIQKYSINPESIVFEITETLYAENPSLLRSIIDRFHEHNFKISMDDFGSGYSSLNVLKNFAFDNLKIDLKFLQHINDSAQEREKGYSIISSIVEMSNKLNISSIVEGVETKEQLELVKQSGCDYTQGYYYSKPVPVDQFLKLLSKGYIYVKE